jgi:hypothetical protein
MMSKAIWIGGSLFALAVAYAQPASSNDAPLAFSGHVGMMMIEDPAYDPSRSQVLVLTILNPDGARIKFCNTARWSFNLGLALSNPQAPAIQQALQQAQATGRSVTGVASEDTSDSAGMYCGIASLTLAP